ncbi:hypothetical protein ACRAQ6_08375 [Erythrobacter sp. HA6-11]
MTARIAQFYIAFVFLGLGGWALFFPAHVIEYAITEAYQDSGFMVRFALACFGAQAVLFGIMALVVRWSALGFLVYALSLLPFFWFNYHFHYVEPVLTSIGMLDFAGNITMLIAAIVGWNATRKEERMA